jgi:hypothetical protein
LRRPDLESKCSGRTRTNDKEIIFMKQATMFASTHLCRRVTLAVLGVLALGLCVPKPAAASSCSTYLGNINNWFLTKPLGNGYYNLSVRMIEMNSAKSYSAYAEGSPADGGTNETLNYHAAAGGYPAYVQDAGAQANSIAEYFSDRRYQQVPNPFQPNYPFNPGATDNLGTKFYLQDDSAKSITAGETILTLYSWGNATATFPTTCTSGMLYAFINNSELFAFQLKEVFESDPPARTRRHGRQGHT